MMSGCCREHGLSEGVFVWDEGRLGVCGANVTFGGVLQFCIGNGEAGGSLLKKQRRMKRLSVSRLKIIE